MTNLDGDPRSPSFCTEQPYNSKSERKNKHMLKVIPYQEDYLEDLADEINTLSATHKIQNIHYSAVIRDSNIVYTALVEYIDE